MPKLGLRPFVHSEPDSMHRPRTSAISCQAALSAMLIGVVIDPLVPRLSMVNVACRASMHGTSGPSEFTVAVSATTVTVKVAPEKPVAPSVPLATPLIV